MKLMEYPGDVNELLDWVNEYPHNRYIENTAPAYYEGWVKENMPAENSDIHYWVTYVRPLARNLTDLAGEPLSLVDWNPGFPHIHSISQGWERNIHTLMTYLQPADLGGEIGVAGYTDGPYTFYKPYPGMAVLVDSDEWHGVKPVLKGTRIALLATGFPPNYEGRIPGYRDVEVR